MRLMDDSKTLTDTPLGTGIFDITPADINIATAYSFEIRVHFNTNEPNLYVVVQNGPYKLVVGCLQVRSGTQNYYFEVFPGEDNTETLGTMTLTWSSEFEVEDCLKKILPSNGYYQAVWDFQTKLCEIKKVNRITHSTIMIAAPTKNSYFITTT